MKGRTVKPVIKRSATELKKMLIAYDNMPRPEQVPSKEESDLDYARAEIMQVIKPMNDRALDGNSSLMDQELLIGFSGWFALRGGW